MTNDFYNEIIEDFFDEEDDDLDGADAEFQDSTLDINVFFGKLIFIVSVDLGKDTNGDHDFDLDPERYEDAEEEFPEPSQ